MTTPSNHVEFIAQAISTAPHHIGQVGQLLGDLGVSVSSINTRGQFFCKGDFSGSPALTDALVEAMEDPRHALEYVAPRDQLHHLAKNLAGRSVSSAQPPRGFCHRVTPGVERGHGF